MFAGVGAIFGSLRVLKKRIITKKVVYTITEWLISITGMLKAKPPVFYLNNQSAVLIKNH